VQYEQTYDGVPYEEITKALVDLMGGAPAHGNRNNFIYRERRAEDCSHRMHDR
jgi:hypothetical protein